MSSLKDIKTTYRRVLLGALAIIAGGFVVVGLTLTAYAQAVNGNANTNATPSASEDDQISQQIADKQAQIDELKRQQEIYEQQIESRQAKSQSLQDELATIDVNLQDTQVKLTLANTQIDSLQLEIQKVQREIALREQDISDDRAQLSDLLRKLYESDQVSNLELFVEEQSLSSFFSHVQELHTLSGSVHDSLNQVVEAKRKLDVSKEDLDSKRSDLDAQRTQLATVNTSLTEQQDFKQGLLSATQNDEQQYADLVSQVAKQQSDIEGQISIIVSDNGQVQPPGTLSWPVNPSRGISAYFHDPSYPYRNVFAHNGVDIPTPQGTPVAAAADGEVVRVAASDWTSQPVKNRQTGKTELVRVPALNFVYVDHGGGIVTAYLHLSKINVSIGQQLKRGQIIGNSGATPGTAGAGLYTTGPHLHFGVFLNGIAVDPMKYLPAL